MPVGRPTHLVVSATKTSIKVGSPTSAVIFIRVRFYLRELQVSMLAAAAVSLAELGSASFADHFLDDADRGRFENHVSFIC
jgi:hypothetical protein